MSAVSVTGRGKEKDRVYPPAMMIVKWRIKMMIVKWRIFNCFHLAMPIANLGNLWTTAGLEIYISRQWTTGPPAMEIWWSCQISNS